MMKDLSIPPGRIQLEKVVRGDSSDPAQAAVQVAALNVLTAIVETLTFDIHYLSDSGIGISLTFFSNPCSPRPFRD